MCGIMLVLRAVFNKLVSNTSLRGHIHFMCPMFNCILDLSCGECDVISLYFMCYFVNGSVCLVSCMFDSVCEWFGETIRNMFGCGCYFVVENYGCVQYGWRCSVG